MGLLLADAPPLHEPLLGPGNEGGLLLPAGTVGQAGRPQGVAHPLQKRPLTEGGGQPEQTGGLPAQSQQILRGHQQKRPPLRQVEEQFLRRGIGQLIAADGRGYLRLSQKELHLRSRAAADAPGHARSLQQPPDLLAGLFALKGDGYALHVHSTPACAAALRGVFPV